MMLDELLEARETESMEELCARLGTFLGYEQPVAPSVIRRFSADPEFAQNLITCRQTPAFLQVLLNSPETRKYEQPEDKPPVQTQMAENSADPAPVRQRTSLELAAKAAKAFMKWGQAGFSQVDAATYQRRLDACRACPHFVEAGQQIVYRLATTEKDDRRKICNVCGCVVASKARLPGEACPMPHSEDPALNRWHEPIRSR